ncbi:MAG: glf, partial [Mycetocola sp.]|nr:glf [Mycetocola sp.]
MRLNTDFFDEAQPIDRTSLVGQVPVVYTGRVDRSFDYSAGELSWRTLDCELEVVAVVDYHGASVMSYADAVVRFTRTHEFRHYHPERDGYPADKTVILREFSRFATRDDEPYYPVNTADDRANLRAYRVLQAGEKDVFFGGRLGTYPVARQAHGDRLGSVDVQQQAVRPFRREQTTPPASKADN